MINLICRFIKPGQSYKSFLPIVIFCCLMAINSGAVEFKGRLTSDLYIFEQDEASHVRPYERLQSELILWKKGYAQSVSFISSLRLTTDFNHKDNSDPEIFIYSAYFKLHGFPAGSRIRLGRQFVYNSSGSGLMDGISMRLQPLKSLSWMIFGGSSVSPTDPQQFRSPDKYALVGSQFSYRISAGGQIALSYFWRRDDGATYMNKVGLKGRFIRGKWGSVFKAVYNNGTKSLAEIRTELSFSASPWYFSGEFRWREPSVALNSIFSLVDFHRTREVSLRGHRYVWKRMAIVGQVRFIIYKEDQSQFFRLGIKSDNYSLSWIHRTGYGGENDGLTGYGAVKLGRKLTAYGSIYISRYRSQTEQESLSDAYTSRLGLKYSPGKAWLVSVEGQYLRNAVEENSYRLHFSLSKAFSFLSGSNGR